MVLAQGLEGNRFLQKIRGVVNQYSGRVASNTISSYKDAGKMQTEAGKVVDPDPLHAGVNAEITPIAVNQIKTQVDQYTGRVSANAINAYKDAGKMQTEAGKVVDPDPLHAGVIEQVTPIVANQVINQVGAKNTNADSLMDKYPASGKMLSVADKARIIDKTQANITIDATLSPNLAKVQKEAFRSGNWDKLALQKVAEESKLFSEEALATVKSVITDLLETSVRTSVAWGDKRGALDKLNLVASTGLVSPEDVAKYREEFLLRDSLIDAQG